MLVTSPDYFSMLGAAPQIGTQIGRLFDSRDATPGYAPVAVISDSLWRRNFAADPRVLGRTIHLDNDPYAIIGVLPASFRHPGGLPGRAAPRDVEVWVTSGFSAAPNPTPTRSGRSLPQAYGRLKSGVTLAQAQDRLTAMANQLRHEYPADYPAESNWTIEIQPLQEALVGDVRPLLLFLQCAVLLIVLIVSLNIATLLLARAAGRRQEMALRSALAASPGRIVRQMLTEALLLSFIGGAAGVALAMGAVRFMPHFIPPTIPRLSEVSVDWTVLAFALLLSLFCGVLFGLAPALQSAKADLSTAIREGTRGSGRERPQQSAAGRSDRVGAGCCGRPHDRRRLIAADDVGPAEGGPRLQSHPRRRRRRQPALSQRSEGRIAIARPPSRPRSTESCSAE